MIIKGHLGKPPEKKLSTTSGRPYYVLRVAENYGRESDRTAVWFDVVAAIPPLEADMLAVGQVVSVEGRLEPQAYVKKRSLIGEPVPTTWEGVIKVLQKKGALAAGLKVFTQSVKPDRFERKARTAEELAQSPVPAQIDVPAKDTTSLEPEIPVQPIPVAEPLQPPAPAAPAARAPF